ANSDQRDVRTAVRKRVHPASSHADVMRKASERTTTESREMFSCAGTGIPDNLMPTNEVTSTAGMSGNHKSHCSTASGRVGRCRSTDLLHEPVAHHAPMAGAMNM